ncbi:nitroreductase family protein [Ochrobactrum sp. BTU1]|nr:nitroreductase family protein [Ochrobactrum sp. BTU1]
MEIAIVPLHQINHEPETIIDAIERRVSTNHYDTDASIDDAMLCELVRLATLAPTAFNLQNWRFIAVRSLTAKELLWEASGRQDKIKAAAATFIVCGRNPKTIDLQRILRLSVTAGFMPETVALGWVDAVHHMYGNDPQMQRDEAIRSATFGAANLMYAAAGYGLATGAMVGFDPIAVSRDFGLAGDEVPVLLMTVGKATANNWPQKPRCDLREVLEFA